MPKHLVLIHIDDDTNAKLADLATERKVTVPGIIAKAVASYVNRPDWSHVAELAALAAEVELLLGERDRARDSAILHEAHAYTIESKGSAS